MVGGCFLIRVREGFSEEVIYELRLEGGAPSHVEESGKVSDRGKSKCKSPGAYPV